MTPDDRARAGAFADEAERFCAFVQNAGTLALDVRTEELALRLARLYASALALPVVTDEDAFVARANAGADLDAAAGRGGAWAGVDEPSYWEVFDPFVDEPPVMGDIDDDVLDIARDLAQGIEEWRRGDEASAAWHWRFTFESHWGEHLVDALRAVHRLVQRARR